MTLVDEPETVRSESTGSPTGNEGNGDQANADAPEGNTDPLEQESVQGDQGRPQEDHTRPTDDDLELGVTEEEVAYTDAYLSGLNDTNHTPTGEAVEKNQEVHQFQRLANEMEEKLEAILQSVKRQTPGHGIGISTSSPDDTWSGNSQRQLKFEDPKPKVVFFEPGTISRGPTRRDSQAWNEVITDASKQAEVHKTPGKQDLVNFSTRNKVLQQKQIVIDGGYVTLAAMAKPQGGLGV